MAKKKLCTNCQEVKDCSEFYLGKGTCKICYKAEIIESRRQKKIEKNRQGTISVQLKITEITPTMDKMQAAIENLVKIIDNITALLIYDKTKDESIIDALNKFCVNISQCREDLEQGKKNANKIRNEALEIIEIIKKQISDKECGENLNNQINEIESDINSLTDNVILENKKIEEVNPEGEVKGEIQGEVQGEVQEAVVPAVKIIKKRIKKVSIK